MSSSSRAAWLAGAAALGVLWPRPLRAQTTSLRFGAITTDTFGLAYYGLDSGIFKRAGIDAEITPFNNGAVMAAAAAGGAIDLGVGEASELANGVSHGLPFAIIAGASLYLTDAPTTLLCVGKGSPVKSARDLEGGSVAVPGLVGLSPAAVRAWIDQNGVDEAKVRIVEMPLPQMAESVSRGVVTAAHIGEPQMTAGAALISSIAKPYDAIAKRFLLSDWFTTRPWIDRNRDLARRFVAAAYETANWANENRDRTLTILAKYAKYDLERVRGMRRATFATALDPRLIQPVLDAAARYKMLERPFDAKDLIVAV